MVGVRGPIAIPPGETVSDQLLIEYTVVQVEHEVRASALVSPFGHRFDASPKHRSSDCLPGLRPVRLAPLGRIEAVELHTNDLPGLAEEMDRIAVEDPMHRSPKRLASGRNRNAEEQPKQGNRKTWPEGCRR